MAAADSGAADSAAVVTASAADRRSAADHPMHLAAQAQRLAVGVTPSVKGPIRSAETWGTFPLAATLHSLTAASDTMDLTTADGITATGHGTAIGDGTA